MREPGARVEGHQGLVRRSGATARVACACGYPFTPQATVQGACLALAQHLQGAVRDGARVIPGDEGLAGVREPRRPLTPLGSATVELDADER